MVTQPSPWPREALPEPSGTPEITVVLFHFLNLSVSEESPLVSPPIHNEIRKSLLA